MLGKFQLSTMCRMSSPSIFTCCDIYISNTYLTTYYFMKILQVKLLVLHFSEPTMEILNRVVIPKISAEWENVAHMMKYHLNTISTIEKESHNFQDRCQKLFKNWLTTSNGPSPKTWKTLLKCIENVEDLTAAVEEIKTELVKGNESNLFVMMFT